MDLIRDALVLQNLPNAFKICRAESHLDRDYKEWFDRIVRALHERASSNDRLMVRKDDNRLTLYGIPKMPRVNRGTILNNRKPRPILSSEELARFESLPTEELWTFEHKYDALIPRCYGPGRFKLKVPMAGLVVFTWKRDGGAMAIRQVDLRQRRDLMPAFMKDVGLFFESEDSEEGLDFSQEAHLDLLEHCPVYEITGGVDFKGTARWCSEWLSRQRSSQPTG